MSDDIILEFERKSQSSDDPVVKVIYDGFAGLCRFMKLHGGSIREGLDNVDDSVRAVHDTLSE